MSALKNEVKDLKTKYREIFLKANEELIKQIHSSMPDINCVACENKCKLISQEKNLLENYPINCEFRKWQKGIIKQFDEKTSKDVFDTWSKMVLYRGQFTCSGCATCCKLACSEFSPDELKEKAKNGDNFATQFLSVFVPYKSKDDARKFYPEYFELLEEKFSDEEIHFYYCPKLGADNRCTDYENRPQICRDFPDNPLTLLPPKCGYHSWKQEVEPTALMLHSMLEIMEFYKEKLSELV